MCAQCVAKYPRLLHAESEDSDQTGRMHRSCFGFVMLQLKCLAFNPMMVDGFYSPNCMAVRRVSDSMTTTI